MEMPKPMHAGAIDSCTIREDVRARQFGWAQAGFIHVRRRLDLKGKCVVFFNS